MSIQTKQQQFASSSEGLETHLDSTSRTIRISPDEVTFTQVLPNITYSEQLTMTNTLTAPVELSLRTSNSERLEVYPKLIKLAPQASSQVEIKLYFNKQFHKKAMKVKDYVFIKSDFFDQKVPVNIYPGSSGQFSISSGTLRRASTPNTGQLNSPQNRNMITLAGESFGRQTIQFDETHKSNNHQLNSSFDREEVEDQNELQILREKLQFQIKENSDLRSLLEQTQMDFSQLQSQQKDLPEQMKKIGEMLNQRDPNLQQLMDEVLSQERLNQQRKEQKVLQILLQKDKLIEQLRLQIADQQTTIEKHKDVIKSRELLQNQSQMQKKQIMQLELQLAETKDMLQEFNSTDLMKNQAQLQSQSAYVRDLENQIKSYQETSRTESFFSEALERSKHEISLKDAQLKQIVKELDQLKTVNTKLEKEIQTKSKIDTQAVQKQIEQNLRVQIDKLQNQLKSQQQVTKETIAKIKNQTNLNDSQVDMNQAVDFLIQDCQKNRQNYENMLAQIKNIVQTNVKGLRISKLEEETESDDENSAKSDEIIAKLKYFFEQLKDRITEQDLEIKQLDAIVKATGNDLLIQNQKSTLGGISDKNKDIIFVSDTLQVGSNSGSNQQINARMQEMKLREEKLIQQISQMKLQIKYQSSSSDPQLVTQQDSTDRTSVDQNSLRVAELENLIFQQREQLINLEEQLVESRNKIQNQENEKFRKIEILTLENKHLQELNKKIETIQVGGASSMDLFGSLNKSPFTASETERVRQQTQNTDLKNMEFVHKTKEFALQRDIDKREITKLSEIVNNLQSELIKARQDLLVSSVGLNQQESQLPFLVQQQKDRINYLEQIIKQSDRSHAPSKNIIAVRDEFLVKLEEITEQCQTEKQHYSQQLIQSSQKFESLKSQLNLMEKREQKQHQQYEQKLEEASGKFETLMSTLNQTEKVLEAKNALIFQLEKEVQQLERTGQERQEQLSVLLSAMDNGNASSNDQKQKLANLAAEVCQLMTQKSELQIRIDEQIITQRQQSEQQVKFDRELQSVKDQLQSAKTVERQLRKQLESSERKGLDMEQKLVEIAAELSDKKFNAERQQFQLKSKDENISAMKEMQKKSESSFKEQINQIKQSVIERVHSQQTTHRKHENELRICIQKLNLALVDSDRNELQGMAQDFQNALQIAGRTVEKLQEDLDLKSAECDQLNQQWDAMASFVVISQRYESCLQVSRQQQSLFLQREVEISAFNKCTLDQQINNVIAELENELVSYQQKYNLCIEELQQIHQQKNQYETEKHDLKQQLLKFETESKLNKPDNFQDQRLKHQEQQLKMYFDSHLSKIIVGSNGQERVTELGREICALKLQNNQLQNQMVSLKDKFDQKSAAMQLQKQMLEEQTVLNNQLESTITTLKNRINSQTAQSQSQLDKEKKRTLHVQKELIRSNELVQQKSREIASLKQTQQQSVELASVKTVLSSPQNNSFDNQNSKRIQDLQEEVIELRQGKMFEIDEIRLQYELELAHLKRELQSSASHGGINQQDLLSQHQELVDQVNELNNFNNQLQDDYTKIQQENRDAEQQIQNLTYELEDAKQAMQELQIVLTNETDAVFQRNQTNSKKHKTAQKSETQKMKSVLPFFEQTPSDKNAIKFIQNPPALVRALVQSKLNEQNAKSKLRRQLQVEANLHQMISKKLPQNDLVQELIVQNDAILQILNHEQMNQFMDDWSRLNQNCTEEDYDSLVVAVLALSTQLAHLEQSQVQLSQIHEKLPLSQIVQAQRIVINSLAVKNSDRQIRFVPERDQDRKLWFLQLLEQQISDAEVQTDRLMDFIKRLQVAVSGNLQSVAEIRATSIDLAQNTKEASEEMKTLRHFAALMKHEITVNPVSNPFNEDMKYSTKEENVMTVRSLNQGCIDKLMTERDSAQSQISLSSKIKQSLEQELINLKLQHANELQTQIQNLRSSLNALAKQEKVSEQLQTQLNQAQEKIQQKDTQLEDLQKKIDGLEYQFEKAVIKNEKVVGSQTSLKKLQQDMQEWRKQSEVNLKQKQIALDTAQIELQKAKSDIQRLKSENQMLRRVQSDIRSGEEQTNFMREIDQLRQQLASAEDQVTKERNSAQSRKSELEERISQLEAAISQSDNLIGRENNQMQKQIIQLKTDLKSKQAELIAAKDILAQSQLSKVESDSKLRDFQQLCDEKENIIKELQTSLQKTQSEREDLLRAKLNAIEMRDKDSLQIAHEMVGLRETFQKLKVERDQIANQAENNQKAFEKKEKDWQIKIQELQMQLQLIQGTYVNKATESHESSLVLSERNKVLINDLKYFKEQYEKQQQSTAEMMKTTSAQEALIMTQQQEQTVLIQKCDAMRRETAELKSQIQDKERMIKQNQIEIVELEASANAKLRETQQSYNKLRVETDAAIKTFSQQILIMKQKGDKSKPVKDVDFSLQITQKDLALKQVRKELAAANQKVQKLKNQKQELKEQAQTDPKHKGKGQIQQLPKWKEEILECLREAPNLKKLLKQQQDQSICDAKILELQQELQMQQIESVKSRQQLEEISQQNEELKQALLDTKSTAKDGKSNLIEKHQQTVGGLKDQIRQLNQEISLIRQEFISPDEQLPLLEQIKDLQAALKQSQTELSRKNKLITTLRQQKESISAELELVLQDLKGLRDDNQRLQKAIREGKSSNTELKEIKETNEWLQRQEKQMKEEIQSLYEKNKQLKSEISRKDAQTKDIKDQYSVKSKEVDSMREFTFQIEKLKEDKKRLKVELEIKDNQTKALKQQIEQAHQNPSVDAKSSISSFEMELKQSKRQSRRLEQNLKRSVQYLSRIGSGLGQLAIENEIADANQQSYRSSQKSEADYYKEAGQILGVSYHELEDFINQTPKGSKQSINSNTSQQALRGKIERLQKQVPETLDQDIEEIGEYCVKLINDLKVAKPTNQ